MLEDHAVERAEPELADPGVALVGHPAQRHFVDDKGVVAGQRPLPGELVGPVKVVPAHVTTGDDENASIAAEARDPLGERIGRHEAAVAVDDELVLVFAVGEAQPVKVALEPSRPPGNRLQTMAVPAVWREHGAIPDRGKPHPHARSLGTRNLESPANHPILRI